MFRKPLISVQDLGLWDAGANVEFMAMLYHGYQSDLIQWETPSHDVPDQLLILNVLALWFFRVCTLIHFVAFLDTESKSEKQKRRRQVHTAAVILLLLLLLLPAPLLVVWLYYCHYHYCTATITSSTISTCTAVTTSAAATATVISTAIIAGTTVPLCRDML